MATLRLLLACCDVEDRLADFARRCRGRRGVYRPGVELYHGTRTDQLAAILREGLRSPYLAIVPELAFYYAEAADGEGDEVVLVVTVDAAALVPDRPSLNEPVGWAEFLSAELEARVAACPTAWSDLTAADSLALVGTCLHPGPIAPAKIHVLAD